MNYLNIEKWPEVEGHLSKGSREKKWVYNPSKSGKSDTLEIFLFKESHRRYDAEFWSEIIANRIAKLIKIPAPEAFCANDGNRYGILQKFFLKLKGKQIIEYLVEGGDLITAIDPSFDRKKGERHNVYLVEKVLKFLKKDIIFKDFLQLLVFDAIIGNTDRHQENWGLILNVGEKHVRLAPAYDNSDCFGREILEEHIQGFLDDKNKLIRYILRGKPHMRWSDDGEILYELSHFDFLDKMVNKWPLVRGYIKKQTTFSNQEIEKILSELHEINIANEKYALTKLRCDFINAIIVTRRDLIRKKFC